MITKVFKNKSRVALKNLYTQKNIFQNQLPSNNWKKIGCHLTIPKWWLKMPLDPSMTIQIHSCHLMAIEFSCPMVIGFSQCYWMAIKFNRHIIVATKNLLIATMFPPPLFFLPSSISPPNDDRSPFSRHLVWSFHKKLGLSMGTHWEFEWNMLEQME